MARSNALALISDPYVGDPAAGFKGAQAGNALYKITQGHEADAISGAAAGGDKAALARLYGLDYERAASIDDRAFNRGRAVVADARAAAADSRAAAAEGRAKETFDRAAAADKTERIARVISSATTPEMFEQAKTILAAQGMDVSALTFENRDLYINQAVSTADQFRRGVDLAKIQADAAKAAADAAKPLSNEGKFAYDKARGNLPADAVPATGSGRPTEAMNRNAGLYSVSAPELAIVAETYGALSNTGDQILNSAGVPGNVIKSPAFQRARSAVETIAQSYLYSASGAAAPAEEVKKIVDSVTPVIGDKPALVADKYRRIQRLVDAIKLNAGSAAPDIARPDMTAPPGNGAGGAPRPRATNPQTGQAIEWNGSAWVPVK
jgi:hypothetical protein